MKQSTILIVLASMLIFACNTGNNVETSNSNGNIVIQGDSNSVVVLYEKLRNSYCEQIRKLVQMSKGNLLCEQMTIGNSVTLTFKGKEDFYPLAKYYVDSIPQVQSLANLVSNLYQSFDTLYKKPDYYVDVLIFATSDGHKMDTPVKYKGRNVKCDCFSVSSTTTPSTTINLVNDSIQVNNKTLGCARAGAFYSKLIDNGVNPNKVKLKGKELIQKGGDYRFIRIEISFKNILKYNPKFEICDICGNI